MLIDVRLQLFGRFDEAVARLERPILGRIPAHSPGTGIQSQRIEIPALLVGLSAVEDRSFDFPTAVDDSARYDAVGDVRGVQPVMTDRRLGTLHARESMHESRRAKPTFPRVAEI